MASFYLFLAVVLSVLAFAFGDTLYLWWSDLVAPKRRASKLKEKSRDTFWVVRYSGGAFFESSNSAQRVYVPGHGWDNAQVFKFDNAFEVAERLGQKGVSVTLILVGRQ